MKEIKGERIVCLTSDDGRLSVWVDGLTGDARKAKEQEIIEYEKTCRATLFQMAMSVPHVTYDDSFMTDYIVDMFFPANLCLCDPRVYVFKPRSKDDLEAIYKWLNVTDTTRAYTMPTLQEEVKEPDGTIREQARMCIERYTKLSDYSLDYIGKELVILYESDNDMTWICGTLSDLKNRFLAVLKNVTDDVKKIK